MKIRIKGAGVEDLNWSHSWSLNEIKIDLTVDNGKIYGELIVTQPNLLDHYALLSRFYSGPLANPSEMTLAEVLAMPLGGILLGRIVALAEKEAESVPK